MMEPIDLIGYATAAVFIMLAVLLLVMVIAFIRENFFGVGKKHGEANYCPCPKRSAMHCINDCLILDKDKDSAS